mmetsp:Transcript_16208/g.63206  ORF Transcript_16208/g.63206 Transcript_16208/m.63206 type:complete len:226 (-) Transcript_16208:875-1552(-)
MEAPRTRSSLPVRAKLMPFWNLPGRRSTSCLVETLSTAGFLERSRFFFSSFSPLLFSVLLSLFSPPFSLCAFFVAAVMLPYGILLWSSCVADFRLADLDTFCFEVFLDGVKSRDFRPILLDQDLGSLLDASASAPFVSIVRFLQFASASAIAASPGFHMMPIDSSWRFSRPAGSSCSWFVCNASLFSPFSSAKLAGSASSRLLRRSKPFRPSIAVIVVGSLVMRL